jgi:hypothetical protein
MRTRFAQLSLPPKILLTIACALTLLFAITGAIVWGNIEHSMSSSLKEREETGSDFVFGAKDGVIASSLNPRVSKVALFNLLSAKDSNMVSDGVHNYAWFRQPQDISASEVVEISIFVRSKMSSNVSRAAQPPSCCCGWPPLAGRWH